MRILIKRVYDERNAADGLRVLVDRLWPRGVNKQEAGIDVWAKDLAPSPELRRWFAHVHGRFEEFKHRYRHELRDSMDAARRLIELVKGDTVTLIYAAKSTQINHATVLKEWLEQQA